MKPEWNKLKQSWNNNSSVVLKEVNMKDKNNIQMTESCRKTYKIDSYPTIILHTRTKENNQDIKYPQQNDRTEKEFTKWLKKHL